MAKAPKNSPQDPKKFDPWSHTLYTKKQFETATKDIFALIKSGKIRCHQSETVTVVDVLGAAPRFSALVGPKTTRIRLSIELQDDGREPYAVAELVRYFPAPKDVNTHAAGIQLEVTRLYPHQHAAIPKLISWLAKQPKPDFPQNLLHTASR
jgi:hypothetical protein